MLEQECRLYAYKNLIRLLHFDQITFDERSPPSILVQTYDSRIETGTSERPVIQNSTTYLKPGPPPSLPSPALPRPSPPSLPRSTLCSCLINAAQPVWDAGSGYGWDRDSYTLILVSFVTTQRTVSARSSQLSYYPQRCVRQSF